MSALLLSVYVGIRVFPIYIHILTCICLAYLSNILLVMSTGLWDEHFCIAKCLTNTPKNLQKKRTSIPPIFCLILCDSFIYYFPFFSAFVSVLFRELVVVSFGLSQTHWQKNKHIWENSRRQWRAFACVCVCGFLLFFYLF